MRNYRRRSGLVLALALLWFGATARAEIDYGPWLTGVTQTGVTVSCNAAGVIGQGKLAVVGGLHHHQMVGVYNIDGVKRQWTQFIGHY